MNIKNKIFAISIISLIIILLASACGAISLNLTLDANGGEFDGGGSTYLIKTDGMSVITIPNNPTKYGYKFDNWFWDKDIWVQPFTANSLLDAPIQSSMTVYAKWVKDDGTTQDPVTYTITFNANGGSEVSNIIAEVGETITIPDNPTKEAYNFGGWYYDDISFEDEFDLSTPIIEDTTVYAKWIDINNAPVAVDDTATADEDSTVLIDVLANDSDVDGDTLSITGYTQGINGAVSQEGDSLRYTPVANYHGADSFMYEISDGKGGIATATVNTTINSLPRFTISFNSNDGSAVASIVEKEGVEIFTPEDPEKTGYSFEGWSIDDETFLIEYIFNTMPAESFTLYAKWQFIKLDYDMSGASWDYVTPFIYDGTAKTVNVTGLPDGVTVNEYSNNSFINVGSYTASVIFNYNSINYNTPIIEDLNWEICLAELAYTYISATDSYSVSKGTMTDINIVIPSYHDNGVNGLKSITCIDYEAFYEFRSLTTITIPDSVTSIGSYAFYECSSLETITFGDNSQLTSIGSYVFSNCSSLTSVTLESESPPTIGCEIFNYTHSALKIYVPSVSVDAYKTATGWSDYADKIYSQSLIDENGFVINAGVLIQYIGNEKEITIPSSITSIEDYAFYGRTNLINIYIPNSVISIGRGAFQQCTSLESITLPSNLANISYHVFSNCSSLISITIPSSVTSIGSYALYGCSSLETITFGDNSQLISIASYAYENCTSLTSISIPDSVTTIGSNAFANTEWYNNQSDGLVYAGKVAYYYKGEMPNNTNITLLEGTKGISALAFQNCINLISITLPSSLKIIEFAAFSNCSNLESITIPSSVLFIGGGAFHCSNLTSVILECAIPPSIGTGAFNNNQSELKIYVPSGSVDSYKMASVWSDYTDRIFALEANYDMSGVSWNYVGPYTYDGIAKTVNVTGLPEGVTVNQYNNNSFTDAGTYTASVTFNYNSTYYFTPIMADLEWIIDKATGTVDVSEVQTVFTYIGEEQSISGTTGSGEVSYENNSFINAGTYTVTVNVAESENHSATSTTVDVTVLKADYDMSGVSWDYFTSFIYDETAKTVNVTDLPSGVTINQYIDNSKTNAGSYTASVTFNYDSDNYNTPTLAVLHWEIELEEGTEGLSYIYREDRDSYSVSKGTATDTNIVIASHYDDGINGLKPVTRIDPNAFSGSDLTSITIPNSVTSIGNRAFCCCSSLVSITIPEGVTSISDWAFRDCTSLTSIIIPNSVTKIGNLAFLGCRNLENITIPDKVTSIGEGAFYQCSRLVSIIIPASVTSIGEQAFVGCISLVSINIPDGVTTIGGGTFINCSSLVSITIPDSVLSIGWGAFYGCSNLVSITIPDSVARILRTAFYGCNSLENIEVSEDNGNYKSIDGILFNKEGTELIQYPIGRSETHYSIPSSVTSIGDEAFYGCSDLTSITIPDSVINIGENALDDTVWYNNQPDGVVYAGKVAYKYKGEMPANISITLLEGTKGIAGGAFSWHSSLVGITIPEGVTSIGDRAFSWCNSLTSIIIPNSVTRIGDAAFYDTPWYNNLLDGLVYAGKVLYGYKGEMPEDTSITLLEGTKEISNSAFYGCHNLTSITIPDSIISIGDHVFADCTMLTNITIPSSVTSIGNNAFNSCSNLTSVTVERITPPTLGQNTFCCAHSNLVIYVPIGSVDAYKTTYGWSEYSDKIFAIDSNKLNYDMSGASWDYVTPFIYDGTAKTVNVAGLPDGVTVNEYSNNSFINVGSYTASVIFNYDSINYNTPIIEELNWEICTVKLNYDMSGASWDYVTPFIYDGTAKTVSVTGLPDGVTVNEYSNNSFINVGSYTASVIFNYDSINYNTPIIEDLHWEICLAQLAYTYIPAIDSYSVSKGTTIDTNIVIPNQHDNGVNGLKSVTCIGYEAFYELSSLVSITIPDSITSIGSYAFYGCSSLETITFGDNSQLISIDEGTFYNCSSLISITIPDSITSIGSYAFYGCSSLETITFGDNSQLTSIGSGAFVDTAWYDNQPDGVVYAGKVVYKYKGAMPANTSIALLDGTKSITDYAFSGCSNFEGITIPSSVTNIGEWTLSGCSNLINITFGENSLLTSIGFAAFASCTNLVSITIPNSVSEIDHYTFMGCSSLTNVIINQEVPPSLESTAFTYYNGSSYVPLPNVKIYVPIGSVDTYKSASGWNVYADKIYAIVD